MNNILFIYENINVRRLREKTRGRTSPVLRTQLMTDIVRALEIVVTRDGIKMFFVQGAWIIVDRNRCMWNVNVRFLLLIKILVSPWK